jgi:hypothetical protein
MPGIALRLELFTMRYRLRSVDELRACLCRTPDSVRVDVDRGLAVSAETVADLSSLSTLPPGLVLVIDVEPRFNVVVRLERA